MEVLHFLIVFIYLLLSPQFALVLKCEDNPVGMQNDVIPDHNITASSGTAGDQARLSYTNGPSWCAMGKDTNPYLQIDLGTPHIIYAVSTQGNPQAEEWVKTFHLSFSADGLNYEPYAEHDKSIQTFYGNVDNSGIVKHILYDRIITKFLRILPKIYHGAVCLRAEIYGMPIQSDNLALKKNATQSSWLPTERTSGAAWKAVDDNRDGTWLGGSCTHCDIYRYKAGEWWQVNLGSAVHVAEVSVFSRTHPEWGLRLWNTLFELIIGSSEGFLGEVLIIGANDHRCGGKYGIIPSGSITIVCNPTRRGRYVTIRQIDVNKYLSLCEVEVYGVASDPVCVRNPVGLSKPSFPSNRLKASSYYYDLSSAAAARLNGLRPWIPRDNDGNPWLQIDLVEMYYVCAVATQGDPNTDQRTKRYAIQWSLDNSTWEFVKNKTSNDKMIFTGNRDRSSIIKHILPSPLTVRMIRFYLKEKNIRYALRVEIYGVRKEKDPPKPIIIGNRNLNSSYDSYVDLVCRADRGLGIKWYYNDTDITRYSNGTVRSRGILISKLRINYTAADDVYDKYSCGEVLLQQKRRCTSLEYICLVNYNFYRKQQDIVKLVTELRLPKAPNILATETTSYSALIRWKQRVQTTDQGNITGYIINIIGRGDLFNNTHGRFQFNVTSLEPNTSYTVRLKAVSRIGESSWSDTTIVTTQQSEATTTKENTTNVKTKDMAKEKVLKNESQDTPNYMIIAIAVVVSLLIIIAAAMVAFILWYKRRRKSTKPAVKVLATFKADTVMEGDIEDNDCPIVSIGVRSLNVNQDDTSSTSRQLNSNVPSNEIKESSSVSISADEFSTYMRNVRKSKYEELLDEFENLGKGQQFPCTSAKKMINKIKNRYGNIAPYEASRVILEKLNNDEDSDYINASYILGFDRKNTSYIASQGPVPQTVVDFWRMIWQEKTSIIVMLTGLVEGQKTKCEKYWPENCETYLDLSVKLLKTEVFSDYSIRSFLVSKVNVNEERYVFQYHFTAWPDKGVPQHATQLLAFRKRLVSETAMGSPWLVHCSAGVGRTGTFLAIDAMLRQAQENNTIDVFSYVKAMRETRPYMVQTTEQYVFVHVAILEYLTCGITEIRAQELREEMNKLAKIDENENLSGYEMEFKHLSNVCPPVQDDEIITGNKPCNNEKNRFLHIVPLDKARVILQVNVDDDGANYINASYANGYRQRDAYILTQAPLDNTIADFWKMIYDKRLGTIVMLNSLEEGDVNYPKYWPQEGSHQFGDITVEIIKEKDNNSVTSRTFTLTDQSDGPNSVHEVRHYQHTDWSEGAVPNKERTVLDLIEKLQRSQQQSGNKSIIVQCSDGVGRSGTVCTILSLLDRVKAEQIVDVFQTIKALRISRPGAVETAVQYKFCFQLVVSYLECFSDYSNFDG